MSQCNRVTQQPPDDGLSSTSKSSPMYTGNRITPNKPMYNEKNIDIENKQIAGVKFTENGILIERKYNDVPMGRRINEENFTGKFLKLAKRLAKYRMAHCYKQLHANLSRAIRVTNTEIAWEGGQFQVPVWEALEGILKLNDARDLNPLQAQQIVRSIMFRAHDHNTTTWEIIKESKEISVSEDFKNFITEQLLVARWNK